MIKSTSLINTSPKIETLSKWTNYDNIDFYEKISLEEMQSYAHMGGLDTCYDMKIINSYLDYSSDCSLLEVGAGYGRILNYLNQNNFSGKLSAIERSSKLFKFLQENYSSNNTELIHSDLHNFETENQFDIILWLWGGIANFSQHEQPIILKKIAKSLKNNGLLIIDTLPPSIKPLHCIEKHLQECTIQLGQTTMHAYCPSFEEIKNYTNLINFKGLKKIEYKTLTNITRDLYIMYKLN